MDYLAHGFCRYHHDIFRSGRDPEMEAFVLARQQAAKTARRAAADPLTRPERGKVKPSGMNAYVLGAALMPSYGDPQVVTPWPARRPHPQELLDCEHDVYCLYDEDDNLLYVGMTWNMKRRFNNHAAPRSGSPWWPDVRRYDVRIVPNRAAAEALEQELIWSLGPICNQPTPKDLAEFGREWSREEPPCDEYMSWPGK